MRELVYPYLFQPVPVRKPWAGRELSSTFPGLIAEWPDQTGELALVADVDGLHAEIDNGPARGMTLTGLARRLGDEPFREMVIGQDRDYDGSMPLMLKLLDTAAPLSVQVHPSDRRRHGKLERAGKTESWLVLRAQPGAVVYQAKREGLSEAEFWDVVERGDPAQALNAIPLERGDFLDNPSGLIHALGPGLVLLEIQQACNTTFRIRDWPGTAAALEQRTMHIRDAREAARINLPAHRKVNVLRAHEAESRGTGRENSAVLLRSESPYRCYSLMLKEPLRLRPEVRPTLRLLMLLDGDASLNCRTPSGHSSLRLRPGQATLIPAGCTAIDLYPHQPSWLIEASPGEA